MQFLKQYLAITTTLVMLTIIFKTIIQHANLEIHYRTWFSKLETLMDVLASSQIHVKKYIQCYLGHLCTTAMH